MTAPFNQVYMVDRQLRKRKDQSYKIKYTMYSSFVDNQT